MGAATAGNELCFTIGHSSRSVAEMAEVLHEAGADCIVDVRTVPRSRTMCPRLYGGAVIGATSPTTCWPRAPTFAIFSHGKIRRT